MCQLRMKSVLEGHSHGMLSMSRANNQQRRIDLSWMTSENVSFWERRRSGHPNLRYISPTLKLTAWLIISATGCVSQPPTFILPRQLYLLRKLTTLTPPPTHPDIRRQWIWSTKSSWSKCPIWHASCGIPSLYLPRNLQGMGVA